MATRNGTAVLVGEDQVSEGGNATIDLSMPYRLEVGITGTADLLFHRWNIEAVAEKAAAAKGSKAKKTDDIESYVYRDEDGFLCIPGQNFAASIQYAGKFFQDPRSPRKSAFDLCKAGVIPLSAMARLQPETQDWDYEHAARVTVQRAGVTRVRPAMRAGWQVVFDLLITTPEYLPPATMTSMINTAGRLIGICDFRPTYGRFSIHKFEVHSATEDI